MSWSNVKHYDIQFYTPVSLENRTHRLCKLPNGMETLLISDPTENSSGCSLTVATGSHNDPDEIPGLAHLCEHMLLAAGSRRFPVPGTYHGMIAKYNGLQNAFTTGEQTSFYFELPSIHTSEEMSFHQAVEVFSSFFVEPLFQSDLINKEIYAIESEHNGNLSSSSKIFYHAARLLSSEKHPFHRFGTGNMSTLKSMAQAQGLNLKDELQHYFDENYLSSHMTLCIRGPQSVNALAKIAIKSFGDIPMYPSSRRNIIRSIKPSLRSPKKSSRRSKLTSPVLTQEEDEIHTTKILSDTWKEKYANCLCFSESEKQNAIFVNVHKLPMSRIFFPVHWQNTRFTKKDVVTFAHFWSEIFGDESEGSLCHYFKQEGWITSCYAFTSDFATNGMGLVLELSLTNTGWKKISSIVETISYVLIPLFSGNDTLTLSKFLSDQCSIDVLRFIYLPKESSPMQECSSLSCLMQEDLEALDLRCLFKGSPILSEESSISFFHENTDSERWWIGQAINFQMFLKEFMTTNNIRLILLGDLSTCPFFTETIQQDYSNKALKRDAAYDFEYLKVILNLNDGKPSCNMHYNFHFPKENCFKPKWANCSSTLNEILMTSSNKCRSASLSFAINSDLIKTIPTLVSQNEHHEMWILPDDVTGSLRFKSVVSIDVLSMQIKPSPENTMHLETLIQILFISLCPSLYPSIKLGFSYEFGCSTKGDVSISFTISGFSDGLKPVLVSLISTIRRIATDPEFPSKELLRKARVLVRNTYQEAANRSGVDVASVGLLVVLEKNMWTFNERMNALEDIDMEGFKAFCRSFLDGPKYLNLFIQGDISCADELNSYLNDSFTGHLQKYYKVQSTFKHHLSTKELEPGTNVYIQQPGQKDDPNNSIVYFIQTGKRNEMQILSLTAFTEYLLSLSIVSELRNRRQIGYLVMGGLRLLSDTVGLHITVMSDANCMTLESHIDEYFAYLEKEILGKLSQETFSENYVKPYVNLYKSTTADKLQKFAGPANLSNEIVGNVQSGDAFILNSSTMKRHKKFRNQILDKQYEFCDRETCVDLNFISLLTLPRYTQFYKETISLFSAKRSKLSIMITSPMNDGDVADRRLVSQLEFFLKMKGLVISSEEVADIVRAANGKPTLLAMQLFHSFKARNEAWKLCSTILKEITKMIWYGLRPPRGSDTNSIAQAWDESKGPAVALKVIEDIKTYKDA